MNACEGGSQHIATFRSHSNSIDVILTPTDVHHFAQPQTLDVTVAILVTFQGQFLFNHVIVFKIEFTSRDSCFSRTADGCGAWQRRGDALVKINNSSARIECPHTGKVSYLTCSENKWVGYAPNCSAPLTGE